MKEWIIAMLVIIGLLIIRDMAKTVFSGKSEQAAACAPLLESHPQKEQVERYAEAFQKLADTFYELPSYRETLGEEQKEQILRQCHDGVCRKCYQRELCWQNQGRQTLEGAYELIYAMEDGREETVRKARNDWMSLCGRSGQFYEEAWIFFQKEKQNLIWKNQMAESRKAVGQQLTEVSHLMRTVAEDLYEISAAQPFFLEQLRKKLKKKNVLLRHIWMVDREEGRKQMFLDMRTKDGQCVTIQEIAQVLSQLMDCPMTAVQDSRCTLNGEYHTVHFQEDVSYHVLFGVAKVTKEQELISGDNYSCCQEDNGSFLMCLSDGMGSGMEASKESEMVVELLEQFLEAGFSKETAVRMLNSALVLQREDGRFSTLDICTIDLYTGICDFLKAGASTTFIRRDHWVEAISSTSLAVGLMQQLDFEVASRKLYHGDFVIMITDGVLDALPEEKEEETMKEIILNLNVQTPKEMAREILERIMGYCEYEAKDDMTVLVTGMWKK